MKKYKIIIILLAILLVVIFSIGFFYNYQLSSISNKDEKVVVEIKNGTISSIGETLYDNMSKFSNCLWATAAIAASYFTVGRVLVTSMPYSCLAMSEFAQGS